jgi:hypothetical protein
MPAGSAISRTWIESPTLSAETSIGRSSGIARGRQSTSISRSGKSRMPPPNATPVAVPTIRTGTFTSIGLSTSTANRSACRSTLLTGSRCSSLTSTTLPSSPPPERSISVFMPAELLWSRRSSAPGSSWIAVAPEPGA